MKYLIILASLILFCGCTKHKGDITEHIPNATLTIYSPAVNTIIPNSDTVHILAKAVSDETIHGYEVSVVKLNDTVTYFSKHVHDHNSTLMIDQHWKDTIPHPVNAEVIIKLILDHANHTLIRKVPIRIE